MDEPFWLLGLAVVLIADLAIGVLVGWLWRGSRQDHDLDRDSLERLFRRNDELFRVVYTALRQSRESTGRLGQMRDHIRELPTNATTRIVAGLIDTMEGELATTRDRLERHLDLTQEATATARRALQLNILSEPPSMQNSQVTLDSHPDNATTEVVAAQFAQSRSDARREERRPYLREQMAAPYMQGQIPKPEMFQIVQCCDLSSSGVSFLAPDRPKADMIVITIGDEKDLVYRTARVVQVAEVPGDEEFGRRFRIGCEFAGRLHRHLFC